MEGLLCGIGEMARRLGVAVSTLRRWDREGRLKPTSRTPGGHRRYGTAPDAPGTDATVLYARVSCHDQKPDLERQRQRLEAFAATKGWTNAEVIADLGSGLNFRKRGFLRLLRLILERRISRLVLENKDRLLRFGADLVFRLCAAQGIDVVVIEDQPRSFEADLARDWLPTSRNWPSRARRHRSSHSACADASVGSRPNYFRNSFFDPKHSGGAGLAISRSNRSFLAFRDASLRDLPCTARQVFQILTRDDAALVPRPRRPATRPRRSTCRPA